MINGTSALVADSRKCSLVRDRGLDSEDNNHSGRDVLDPEHPLHIGRGFRLQLAI